MPTRAFLHHRIQLCDEELELITSRYLMLYMYKMIYDKVVMCEYRCIHNRNVNFPRERQKTEELKAERSYKPHTSTRPRRDRDLVRAHSSPD